MKTWKRATRGVSRRRMTPSASTRPCSRSVPACQSNCNAKGLFMHDLLTEIAALKPRANATILAHYYQEGEIQELARMVALARVLRSAISVRRSCMKRPLSLQLLWHAGTD